MENIIAFASMTNAMKAKDMLRQNGISARLIRTPANLRRGSPTRGYLRVTAGDLF